MARKWQEMPYGIWIYPPLTLFNISGNYLTLPSPLGEGRFFVSIILIFSTMKKLTTRAAAALAIMAAAAAGAHAETTWNCGYCGASAACTPTDSITAVLNGNTLTIRKNGAGGTGRMANFAPANPSQWYNDRASITSLVIDSGVTHIGNWAFTECAFAAVTLPKSAVAIGDYAFYNCASLGSLTLLKGIASAGHWAFYGSPLTSVEVWDTTPPAPLTLGSGAFNFQNTTLKVPYQVLAAYRTTAGWLSFIHSEAILSLDPVTWNCGWHCDTAITPRIHIQTSVNPMCSSPLPQPAPDSCIVRDTTWTYDTVLTCRVTNSVTATFYRDTLTIAKNTAGGGAVPMANFDINRTPWIDFRYHIKAAVIRAGVSSVGANAFQGCRYLASASIPSGVTGIGNNAFQSCKFLAQITLPEGVVSIGDGAFWGDSALSAVTLPSSVKRISSDAFGECLSLTALTIPQSVTYIGSGAFMGCASLTAVTIPSGVTAILSSTFIRCKSLTSVTLPQGITSIGDGAFWNDSALTAVTIPDSVVRIGENAFYNCKLLTEVRIPQGVRTIGSGAFSGCRGLSRVYNYSAAPQTIASNVFSGVGLGSAALYVPHCTAWAAYGANAVWQNFGQIDLADGGQCTAVTGIRLSDTMLTLDYDDKYTLTAAVLPANASVGAVTWSTSNPQIVKFDPRPTSDPTAQLWAWDTGRAVISVTTLDGGKRAVCTVRVVRPTYSTAAEAQTLPKLAVYPNPAGDMLYITDAFVGEAEIYTIMGVLVLVSGRASINIARLPAGTYIVKAGGRAAKVVKR